MSINAEIKKAVSPYVKVCVPGLYSGTEQTYCTFNYTSFGDWYCDNAPAGVSYTVQVHLFLPPSQNPLALKSGIAEALFSAGFSYPSIADMTEESYQHYIFECEYTEARQHG